LSAVLNDLSYGPHTLELYVADNLGNRVSDVTEFIVGDVSCGALSADSYIVSDRSILDLQYDAIDSMTAKLIIEDASGKMMLSVDNAVFPYTWNLNDNQGMRVPAGRYKAYCIFTAGSTGGHTQAVELVVVNQ
ncbi:MAG: hypothetical protein K2M65_06480, partial [Muribaculaceae bacterium]|nr:hypothetical protein [Muribaculaceae bacterium]